MQSVDSFIYSKLMFCLFIHRQNKYNHFYQLSVVDSVADMKYCLHKFPGGTVNAPVICNHGSQHWVPNSRDFDFSSNKSVLKALHCGDSQVWQNHDPFPLGVSYALYYTVIFTNIDRKQNKHTARFHGYSSTLPPSPRSWGCGYK